MPLASNQFIFILIFTGTILSLDSSFDLLASISYFHPYCYCITSLTILDLLIYSNDSGIPSNLHTGHPAYYSCFGFCLPVPSDLKAYHPVT